MMKSNSVDDMGCAEFRKYCNFLGTLNSGIILRNHFKGFAAVLLVSLVCYFFSVIYTCIKSECLLIEFLQGMMFYVLGLP